ncbi:GtrA family protein [Bradyrhizobium sp. LHD-71]|uniref:GtrA family protein n=1 Tax=Bradyrhizobium sp. LHD-71 TaxID=3072141 RepID=UPI00280DF077|nr:GtrA family protein [Bradyrhizobium sp. LHD-71]MDQ8728045.1 GtrA family protein [Bradyrhizobium sp. LHD-71]
MKPDSKFIVFVLVSGFSAVVNLALRTALGTVITYGLSIVLAYFCGMAIAYVLNRLYVFGRSGRTVASEFVRFGLINLVGLTQVWLVSVALAHYLFPTIGLFPYAETIAHGTGLASLILTSYFGHRYFSFAPRAL